MESTQAKCYLQEILDGDERSLATDIIGNKKNTLMAVLSASLDEVGIILAAGLLGGDISS